MSQKSSSDTTPDGMPMGNQTHLDKYQGLTVQYATLAALNTALALRAPLWDAGSRVFIAAEPGHRIWNGTHCRSVVLGGKTYLLAATTNAVLNTASGGTAGDMAVDANGAVFLNTAGTWAPADDVAVTASRAFLASDLGKRLMVNSSSAVVLDNSGQVGYEGAPPILVKRVGTGAVTFTFGANLKDPNTANTLLVNSTAFLTPAAGGVLVLEG